MDWKESAQRELESARKALNLGNDGRARTCARRAAGIALTAYQRKSSHHLGNDFVAQLRSAAGMRNVPTNVREAAARLQARITHDFTSPSADPIADAEVILRFVEEA